MNILKKSEKTKIDNSYVLQKKHKHYLFVILKESKLFLLFSFLACFLPIFYCITAALIKPDGSQAVMSIGHVAPFVLAFMQISFTISMIIFSRLNRIKEEKVHWKNDSTILSSAIWMSLFVGAIMTICFFLSSFFYIYFSTNKPNTQASLGYSLDYIAGSLLFVFIFPIFTTTTFFIYHKSKNHAIISMLCGFALMFLLSFALGAYSSLKVIGISVGSLIGLVVIIVYNGLIIKLKYPIMFYYPMQVSHFNILISKTILKESLSSISMSIFKGVAIVAISFAIPLTINGFVPLGYQMARVIWFNSMYFIPFIGIGFGEAIRAHYLTHSSKNQNCYLNHTWKNDSKIIAVTFVSTLLICFGAIFVVQPLTNFYVINDYNPFKNNTMPQIDGWGIPTYISCDTFPDFRVFANMKFTPLPAFSGNNFIDMIKFNKWLKEQIANNQSIIPSAKIELQKLHDWILWLNQKNADGISILQFYASKHNITNVGDVINQIISGNKDAIKTIEPMVSDVFSYVVYLWLYSTTNPVVSESFVSLRQVIEYQNVVLNSNGSIINLLTQNNITDIFVSMYLIVNPFNAKSMIYICLFSLLNSIWAILLQTNQRNKKEGMPYWLLVSVYGGFITFLVVFGVLFGVTFKEELGQANPFQFLDAWTFPLVVISISTICVVSYLSYRSYKYLDNQKKQAKNNNIK